MTGQWEKYVEAGAIAMNGGHQLHAVERWGPEVRTVLAAVGPLIAEDTRVRMVEAAGRAVERDGNPVERSKNRSDNAYYPPLGGESE